VEFLASADQSPIHESPPLESCIIKSALRILHNQMTGNQRTGGIIVVEIKLLHHATTEGFGMHQFIQILEERPHFCAHRAST